MGSRPGTCLLPGLPLWVGVVPKPRLCQPLRVWRWAELSDGVAGSMLSITPQAFWHHSYRLLLVFVMCRSTRIGMEGRREEPSSSAQHLIGVMDRRSVGRSGSRCGRKTMCGSGLIRLLGPPAMSMCVAGLCVCRSSCLTPFPTL